MNSKVLIIGALILAVLGFAAWRYSRRHDEEERPGPTPTRTHSPASSPAAPGKIGGKTRPGIQAIRAKAVDLLGSLENAPLPVAPVVNTIAGITNAPFDGPNVSYFPTKKITRTLQ